MAEDIKQVLLEARHRWLRPAEICEILRNYEKFHISPEAPNKPVSGSVFLFNRNVLRYFRKDGHNWRKKKDGKTTKEAHEKLKVDSVDMLHCYYAHGEDNENFQRRSYWLLDPEHMHIVFVHYLEVKGNKTNTSYVRNSDGVASNSENDVSLSSRYCGTSATSNLSPMYEDCESESNQHASSQFNSYPESPLTDDGHSAQSSSYNQLFSPGNENISVLNYASLLKGRMGEDFVGSNRLQSKVDLYLGNPSTGDEEYREHMSSFPVQSDWQVMGNLLEEKTASSGQEYLEQKEQAGHENFQMHFSDTEPGNAINHNFENSVTMIGNENYPFLVKKPLIGLQTEESLQKVDSFSRWMDKELGDADELDVHSSNGISWSIMGGEDGSTMSDHLQVDGHILNPSISQDQLFSIIDFFPNWAYSNSKTKVLVTGSFLKSEQELYQCRWSIMFGEIEVPAVVLADGILCCCSPLQNPGVVPFYVTCSNRLACSELREFEYRPNRNIRSVDINGDRETIMHLYQRFEMILCLDSVGCSENSAGKYFEKQNVIAKIISLMEEENYQEVRLAPSNDKPQLVIGELLLEKQLKEKFYSWLLHRVTEDDKGPMVTDEWGQSALHLAAALGFKWAIMPLIVSGVSIDFRDVNGWTALHWAAFYGREDMVVALVALGATPGGSTDPTAKNLLARSPADLASSSGHKGIAGFLAEISLTSHLSILALKDEGITEASGLKQIQAVSERLAVPLTEEDVPDTLSLKDSLAAVCNATQAAARIHQFFRIQSFQRKQIEQNTDYLPIPEERAIALVAGKASRFGHADGMANSAALQIQKKYRGWKKRKEFLFIREKIVKIQAHVRGHQSRKKYKPLLWSVGILEKVILRWRRKGSGLRGYRSDGVGGSMDTSAAPEQEDEYDFLKEGRRQTEERMQKALSRVQSMAQNPEARAQYRRLLTAVEGLRENKEEDSDGDMIREQVEGTTFYSEEDLLDVASLLDDDAFMSLVYQ